MHDPSTYLSFSGGRYRVINQGMPISNDKETAEEALAAARFFRLKVSDLVWWDGDAGEWREWTSSGSPAARNRAEGVVARPGSFEAGWNDWVESAGRGKPRALSKRYERGWRAAQKAARLGIRMEPIGSPAYHAAMEEMRAAGLVKNLAGARAPRRPKFLIVIRDDGGPLYDRLHGTMLRSGDVRAGEAGSYRSAEKIARRIAREQRRDVAVYDIRDQRWSFIPHPPTPEEIERWNKPSPPYHGNRAGRTTRARKSALTAPRRVATFADLGLDYDSDAFYSVKGGKLYRRHRTGGGGYGRGRLSKAVVLPLSTPRGVVPGFRKSLFYTVSAGVLYARERR